MKKTMMMIVTAAAAVLALNVVTTSKANAATDTKSDATIELNVAKDENGDAKKITLDSAPSFDFGSQDIDASNAKQYTAETVKGNLQVTNPGVAATWEVNSNISAFTGTAANGNAVTLAGAVLTLTDGVAANSAKASNDTLDMPVLASTQELSAADAKVFNSEATATGYTGIGTSTGTYNATLDVPAGNVAGSYKANITWTLSTTPDQDATAQN